MEGKWISLSLSFFPALLINLGFMANGFKPLVALDSNQASYDTIKQNLPDLLFIKERIENKKTNWILNEIGLDIGEIDVLTGGIPCQPFSTAGQRASLQDPRASPLKEYIRFIKEAKPKCFVMEEVNGLLSARIRHVPIIERGKNILTPEELPGSAFAKVDRMLTSLKKDGYKFSYNSLNAADFGVPQLRSRLIFIGCRGKFPIFPAPSHAGTIQENNLLPWSTFWDATCDLQNKEMEYPSLTKNIAQFMKKIPGNGYWKHLPKPVIKAAMGGAYLATRGKNGFFQKTILGHTYSDGDHISTG